MERRFSKELDEKIKGYLTRYETTRSAIIPILHAVQDDQDWISPRDIQELEEAYGLGAVDVRECLTFYTMYRKSPPQPYRIEVCNSICCWMAGAENTIARIKQTLEAAAAAGKPLPFEVHAVECLNVCGYPPVALINKERYLNMTPELALQLIEEYSKKELPAAAVRCAENLKTDGGHTPCH